MSNHKQSENVRNMAVEALRILLMTLIVFGHFLFFGIGNKYNADGSPTSLGYLEPLYLFHVDAFVFISGYYGIKLKWERFATLLIKMVLYSIMAVAIYYFCFDNHLTMKEAVKNIFPVSTCDWWFMSQYLYLMLMAPFINYGVENMNKKQLSIVMIALYLLSFRGFSCLLVFIYLLGRYLRNFPILFIEKNAGKILITTLCVFFSINVLCLHLHYQPEKLFNYMSPFNITSAVAIFYVFRRMTIKWKGIGAVASGVLAAYLITTHQILQMPFNKLIISLLGNNIVLLIFAAVLTVIIIALLDILVSYVIRNTITKLHVQNC